MGRKLLYFDCAGGISGDMTVGALLDLGADRTVLQSALASIPDDSFSVRVTRVKKSAVDCCDFAVLLDEAHENHDHDMAYLYGETNPYPPHDHARHGHTHRTLREIENILAEVDMPDSTLELAGRIFEILGDAEAKAHGVPADAVHFHEVGAIDSIADIVAAAVCLDDLKKKYDIEDVIIPSLSEGSGTVRTQHGLMPVPVPAVLNIAEVYGLNLTFTGAKGEYVTPTGAAFAAAVMTGDTLPERFRVLRTGAGAGKREQALPSILRVMLLEAAEKPDMPSEGCVPVAADSGRCSAGQHRLSDGEVPGVSDSGQASVQAADGESAICKLETEIDDCSGEILGYTMERLFSEGARDVYYAPVFMKKNRPAWELNVICAPTDADRLSEIIFEETTTIGIRRYLLARTCLPREEEIVNTVYGPASVKIVQTGRSEKIYPEYESAARIAREQGVPCGEVYAAIRAAAESGRETHAETSAKAHTEETGGQTYGD